MTQTSAWRRGPPRVGHKAERSRLVRREDIALFTEISGDRNPLHYDEAAARASRFGEIVVQGGVTSAILNALVAEDLPGPGTVFFQVDWRFTAPVRPGTRSRAPSRCSRCARTSRSRSSPPASGARTASSSSKGRRSATRWTSAPERQLRRAGFLALDDHREGPAVHRQLPLERVLTRGE